MTKSKNICKRFSPDEDQVIRDMFYDFILDDIAKKLNRALGSVYGRSKFLGLKLSPEQKRQRQELGIINLKKHGKAYRYPKGHIPVNKGNKMTPELYAKCQPTMFKKGDIPANHREVGSERINVDGYIEIKIADPNKWELKHRHIWRKKHSDIPEGMLVVFKDKNSQNFEENNLELITMQENMLRNTLHNYPDEIKTAYRTIGVLTRKINQKIKP